MSYMLSVCVNVPVDLAMVGETLASLAAIGEIEDISMRLVPGEIAAVAVQVANGAPSQVVTLEPGARRRRKAASNEDNTVAGVQTPVATPGDGSLPGSDGVGASTARSGPAAVTVGESEGSAPLPTESRPGGADPSPNVKIEDLREQVRTFCAAAIQADGARREALKSHLRTYGAKAISELGLAALHDFNERVQKEFA
jgi:hypothetical protein